MIYTKAFLKAFKPRSKLTGSQWADKYRYVAPSTSPEGGPWRTSRVPYLREPMDSATDKRTETVVLCCSSQVGKSEALLNIMGYYADQEPSPQLMLQPTIDVAEAFSKERIDPTFRYSEGLKDKLEEGLDEKGSSRKSSNTIRMKHYAGGYLALVGANSPAGLASRPIKVLLCDEVDRYGVTKEGDPLKLAIQRTTNFNNRKIILASTPTIKGVSQIYEWFMKSDQRHYFVPCPHCNKMIELKWEYVKWEKDENGKGLPMTAGIYCPECHKQVRGAYKPNPEMLAQGKWIPSNRDSNIKGYHINSLYSPWVNLHKLVEEFLEAHENKDKKGLMEFVNLKLGEPWEENTSDANLWERLLFRREYYPVAGVLPQGVLVLTMGVDVQRDRLEATIYGWGKGKESWGIEHHILFGAPDEEHTWEQLDELLRKEFIMPNGNKITVSCTCVDSGDGAYTSYVYRYTRQREMMRVFSIKGRGGANVPFINNPSKNNNAGAILIPLGVDAGKSLLMSRLHIEQEGPNYVHFSQRLEDGFGEEFFKQLTAESLEKKFDKGRLILRWNKVRERNEALDCAVYAQAGLEILNPNFEQFEEYYSKGHISAPKIKRKRTVSKGVTL